MTPVTHHVIEPMDGVTPEQLRYMWDESKKRPLDVLIAAIARSGSTALTCLMNNEPEGCVAFSEPGEMVRAYGYRVAIKQIYAEEIRRFMLAGKPEHVVVLVRNPAHVALSLEHGQWRPVDVFMRKAIKAASILVMLADLPEAIVVRYEDMVSDPSVLADLAKRLEWPMRDSIEADSWGQHRMDEFDRHAGHLTTASVELRQHRERTPRVERFVDACGEYAERFGYA